MPNTQVDYSDQTDIFDPTQFSWPIHVIGVGGIGSALLPPLAKLGVGKIHLWDDDVVEPRNIPSQLIYRLSDVGTPKVLAAADFLERQEADCTVIVHQERVDATTPLSGVVICAVDSITIRADIWKAVHYNVEVPLYLDGRIGGEQLHLLCCNPSDFDQATNYEKWLFPAEKAAELPCSARAVIHPAIVLAGLIINHITVFARQEVPVHSLIAQLKHPQFV